MKKIEDIDKRDDLSDTNDAPQKNLIVVFFTSMEILIHLNATCQ